MQDPSNFNFGSISSESELIGATTHEGLRCSGFNDTAGRHHAFIDSTTAGAR